ncbi:MAG: hypothetical protein ACR2NI_09620 [Pirellulales bacterium]
MPGDAPYQDSQSTVATFGGATLFCTNIQRSIEGGGDTSDQALNVATLNQASGECMEYQPPPLVDCGSGGADGKVTWTIDYYGTAAPSMDQAYTLTITQSVQPGPVQVKYAEGCARCTDSQTTWAVGEVVVGSATFVMEEADADGNCK